MNVFEEIRDRWFRVFEQPTDLDRSRKLQQLPHDVVLGDIKILQERVRELEEEVSGLHSQTSSRFGPLVHFEDGEIYYRIHGLFSKISSITAALTFFNGLLADEATAKKFTREYGAGVLKDIQEIFNFPKPK